MVARQEDSNEPSGSAGASSDGGACAPARDRADSRSNGGRRRHSSSLDASRRLSTLPADELRGDGGLRSIHKSQARELKGHSGGAVRLLLFYACDPAIYRLTPLSDYHAIDHDRLFERGAKRIALLILIRRQAFVQPNRDVKI